MLMCLCIYKQDLALNNTQELICHKAQSIYLQIISIRSLAKGKKIATKIFTEYNANLHSVVMVQFWISWERGVSLHCHDTRINYYQN